MDASGSRKDRHIKLSERTEFGRRLIAARTLREMEQEDLEAAYVVAGGKAYDIGNFERRRVEQGEPRPTPAQWGALKDALGVTEDWFAVPLDGLLRPQAPPGVRQPNSSNRP